MRRAVLFFCDRFHSDDITDKLVKLLDGRVGDPYSDDQLSEIFKCGLKRYEDKIPPGFEDLGKVKDPKTVAEKRRVFGDLIVWKQTIDHAKTSAMPVILVTDDRKEDWWYIPKGKTVGPRPELIEEFHRATGQSILLYNPESFLKYAKEHLKAKISRATIGEVEAEKLARSQSEANSKRHIFISSNGDSSITSPQNENLPT